MNALPITSILIAPCGMNCGLCAAYLRTENHCHGCKDLKKNKRKSHFRCSLRICRKRKSRFCFTCAEFPCERLAHLDKRYRTKYGMSEIANLKYIRDHGIREFVRKENKKWINGKGVYCVHNKRRYK